MAWRELGGFFRFMTAFAALFLGVGLWEWVLSGAVHNLFVGIATLTLIGLGSRFGRRRRKRAASAD